MYRVAQKEVDHHAVCDVIHDVVDKHVYAWWTDWSQFQQRVASVYVAMGGHTQQRF